MERDDVEVLVLRPLQIDAKQPVAVVVAPDPAGVAERKRIDRWSVGHDC